MKLHILISAFALTPLFAMAQSTEPDSIKTQELEEVVVEGRNQRLGAEVSTYIPTSKQRNASQTAADLLNRMTIPQIKISANDDITDLAGKSVDVFIDFLPATKEDLQGMRMQDVRKVEYYDFPSDPRFQGKAHVVNFVMQKYEYGGYVKAHGWENTSNAGQISLFSKLQYKRMTFDIARDISILIRIIREEMFMKPSVFHSLMEVSMCLNVIQFKAMANGARTNIGRRSRLFIPLTK